MIKERPILFSAPMIRAIQSSNKSQTRRIAKEFTDDHAGIIKRFPRQHGCKYGEIGCRLWVRETWATVNSDCGPGFAYRADGAFIQPKYDGPNYGAGPSFNYDKYPGDYTMWYSDLLDGAEGHSWKPSIHMPRYVSRILLEITDISVERLQDISEEDAKAEAAPCCVMDNEGKFYESTNGTYRCGFAGLWAHINGPDSWDANPFVWKISFRDISSVVRL